MFDALSARFAKTFGGLRGKGKISSSDIESAVEEIRSALLEADVAQEVVNLFTNRVQTQSASLLPTLQAGSNQAQAIFDVVNAELISILGSEARRIRFAKNPPTPSTKN
jgi:signal recognition particle subunit SRP54